VIKSHDSSARQSIYLTFRRIRHKCASAAGHHVAMPFGSPTEPRAAGQADWVRLYLLLTALEGAVEDGDPSPAAALQGLHAEHADLLGPLRVTEAVGAAELLRRELRYGRRLLDGLFAGGQLEDRMLSRTERPCATLGCCNEAIGRYCLSCDARRMADY
jgi:hypothetical protein